MPKHARQAKKRSRYIPALDGLRAFAVLAVIFYHMGLGWAPGGLMGVTVFFVISGYLINGLLVAEYDRTGRISLKGFWLRRARRLLPAILLSIAGMAALCTLFNHVLLDKMRPDIVPSLLFYNNWWQIFGDVSYFDTAGAASPLKHFWSLSIEEQFYLVWPLLLLALYKIGLKKTGIRRIALALAVLSAVEMALLYNPLNPDPSRIYYGTDTRAMSLLIGIWLAFAAPSAAFGLHKNEDERPRGWIPFNLLGIAALAGLIAIVGLTNGYDNFSYLGGIALISALSALLIAVAVVPRTWVARLLALPPLVWIGKRSYGMYLWHFPILLLTTDANSTAGVPIWMRFVQIGLIFLVAALSYTFVENPIRSGAIGAWRKRRRNRNMLGKDAAGPVAVSLYPERKRAKRFVHALRITLTVLCCTAVVAVACVGIFATPETNYAALYSGSTRNAAIKAATVSSNVAQGAVEASKEAMEKLAEEQRKAEEAAAFARMSRFEQIFSVPRYNKNGDQIYEPLLIGDSVSLGAEGAFYEVFPNGCLDSVVSRNIWESPYEDYSNDDVVGDYVIFCLGTNNAVVDWQIDDLLAPVPNGKKVILVNTRSTTDWCQDTNAVINASIDRNPKIIAIVDWYGASEGHDEYFGGDGTHLTWDGAVAYIDLIRQAIEADLQ